METLRGAMDHGVLGMGWTALLMLFLFITVLVHELGHCFAARSVGGHAHEILLWPLGGMAYVGHGGSSRDDIKVAAAGPATHFPMVGICAAILILTGIEWQWSFLNLFESWAPFYPFKKFFWSNLVVAVMKLQIMLFLFNLLVPAYPLDGGRILVNLLLIKYGRNQAAMVSTYFSIPIGIAMVIWGFLQPHHLMLLLIGAMVLFEAWQIRRLIQMNALDAHPMFGSTPEYDYMPGPEPRAKRPGFLARMRAKRAKQRLAAEARKSAHMKTRTDEILDKVSREGIQSLTEEERRILDEASKRARGE